MDAHLRKLPSVLSFVGLRAVAWSGGIAAVVRVGLRVDCEIKDPPSVGVYVVGIIEVYATASAYRLQAVATNIPMKSIPIAPSHQISRC